MTTVQRLFAQNFQDPSPALRSAVAASDGVLRMVVETMRVSGLLSRILPEGGLEELGASRRVSSALRGSACVFRSCFAGRSLVFNVHFWQTTR